MKTLSKLEAEPWIWMEEKLLFEFGHNDILIRISKTAICGPDIHIYNIGRFNAKDHHFTYDHRPCIRWLCLRGKL